MQGLTNQLDNQESRYYYEKVMRESSEKKEGFVSKTL
jgi:hypothetical protein